MADYNVGDYAPAPDHNESNARLFEMPYGYFAIHSSSGSGEHYITLVGIDSEEGLFRRLNRTHAFLSEHEALAYAEISASALPPVPAYPLLGEYIYIQPKQFVRRGSEPGSSPNLG